MSAIDPDAQAVIQMQQAELRECRASIEALRRALTEIRDNMTRAVGGDLAHLTREDLAFAAKHRARAALDDK